MSCPVGTGLTLLKHTLEGGWGGKFWVFYNNYKQNGHGPKRDINVPINFFNDQTSGVHVIDHQNSKEVVTIQSGELTYQVGEEVLTGTGGCREGLPQ